jgi:hypothetical protein
MFNLESSITQWREQMLAAGINTTTLDELESHLREEIGKQIQLNQNVRESFKLAVDKLGTPGRLKTEFRKNRRLDSFAFRRFITAPGILAVLWFVSCAHDLMITIGWWFDSPQGVPHFNLPHGLMSLLINGSGCAGSLLLIAGSELGVRILRSVALMYLIICLAQSIPNLGQATDWRIWCGFFAAFSLLTIWVLHREPKQTATA